MWLKGIRIGAAILLGSSLLTIVGSVFGEMVATKAPSFHNSDVERMLDQGIDYQDVTFPTTDNLTLRGWFFPADRPDAPAILYAPATAHDQSSGLSLVPALHAANYHVLLFSYRGHALSDGSQWGFTYGDAESKDLDAAVRFLNQEKNIHQIGVIGHSAGAASAILSAARNPQIKTVVAVAPFNCVDEVWHTSRPTLVPQFVLDLTLKLTELRKGFERGNVCPLDSISQIAPRPVLLIHGTKDRRITEGQARRLYAAAQEPKTLWMVQGASHSGVRMPALDQMMPNVITFLDSALQGEQQVATRLAYNWND